ncbi:YidB family protein [Leeia oryzae]|uniref:YidB family protein n=1 Tax=Leeia oryzae TaxID=356662 RepID=UPI0003654153|nr:YidB family protein [Leeia oryzae]
MGLFDQLGTLLNGEGSGPLAAVSDLIEQQGGIGGLVSRFQEGGLSEIVSSWVSTGDNLPISAEQIQQVIGQGKLADIANQLGISPEEASGQLANLLPGVIDKLTPGGNLPDAAGGLLGQVKSLFD